MANTTEEAARKKPLSGWRGWVFIAVLVALGVTGKWGAVTHNAVLQLIGFGPVAALAIVAIIWSKRKAARDPEFAAKLAESRARAGKRARRKIYGVFVALIISLCAVMLANLAQQG